MNLINDLLLTCRKLKNLNTLSSLLIWDNQTYIPIKGGSYRAQQLAFIEEQKIQIFSSLETKNLINDLNKNINTFNDFDKRNIQLFVKAYKQRTIVPKEILVENKKQESITFSTWQRAKKTNNYALYAPELEKNVQMKQKIASFMDDSKIPFDVFLDEYEPGFSSKEMERIFSQIKPKLIGLLKKIQDSEIFKNVDNLFPLERPKQEYIVRNIANFIGYDLDAGRIDQGEHPMTISVGPGDVRFTVNYEEKNFLSSLFAGLHEAGHAIHGQNMEEELTYYPVSLFGGSGGISESQSRFFENIIGRSPNFWSYYLPTLNKSINKNFDLDEFLLAINKVQMSKIRVYADELTYPLHIILRFEMEQALLENKYDIKELNSIWNEKILEYLGLEIKNDSEGIMQDIHWATSFYGYFPTYALGNLYNSQMYFTMKKELDFEGLLQSGHIRPIREWLTEKVHRKTGFYDPKEFIENITGEELNPNYFIKYLEEKYEYFLN